MKKRKKKVRGTPLSKQKAVKGVIPSPWNRLNELPKLEFMSWYHDHLPDFLWMVLLVQDHLRERTLWAFRATLDVLEKNKTKDMAIQLDHHSLSELDDSIFYELIQPFSSDPVLAKALSPLLILENLPGIERWKRSIKQEDPEGAASIVAAVGEAAGQNSRAATDVAFLIFVARISQGKMHLPSNMLKHEEIELYVRNPEQAPMVASMVRAMRNGTLPMERAMGGA